MGDSASSTDNREVKAACPFKQDHDEGTDKGACKGVKYHEQASEKKSTEKGFNDGK